MEDFLDLRILKTRHLLIDALLDILRTKTDKTAIKVLDICKKANISSITFYKHFNNKVKLLEYSIKEQISNRLPIPSKLKPKNLNQLIYYLIRFFDEFCKQNQLLIIACYNSKNDMQKSYFDILIKTIEFYILKELKAMYYQNDFIELNIWTISIVGGLFNLIVSRCINNQALDPRFAFNSLINMNKTIMYNLV